MIVNIHLPDYEPEVVCECKPVGAGPAEDEALQPVLRGARHPAAVAAVAHHVAVGTHLQQAAL